MHHFIFLLVLILLPHIDGTDLVKFMPNTLDCNSEELRQTGFFLFTLKGQLFAHCHEIKSLILPENNITLIEDHAFKNMKNLKQIDLSSNKIFGLPTGIFSDTENLEELHIFKNQIISLQKNLFANLPYLNTVNLAFNNITYIEEKCFVNVPSLMTINLASNKLKTLQFNIIDDLSSLSVLYLNGNEWNCDINLCEFMHTVVNKFWREPFVPYCYAPQDILGSTFKEMIETPHPSMESNVKDKLLLHPTTKVVFKCYTCSKSSLSWQFESNTDLTYKASQNSGKYSSQSTLTIHDFSYADKGNYTCYVGCPTCESRTWIYINVMRTFSNIPIQSESNTSRNVGLGIGGSVLVILSVCCRMMCRHIISGDSQSDTVPMNRPEEEA